VTEEHPFYLQQVGWTPARQLEPGVIILGAEGTLTVVSNEAEQHPEGVAVYNLEVEQAHTYFVLAEGAHDGAAVWVHNTCLGSWNRVGGHHPISKAALRDAPGYSWRAALSAPDRLLRRLGVTHTDISAAQNSTSASLRRSGVRPTLLRIVKADIQAMVDAGMKVGPARALARRAIDDLRASGVTGPFRFPGS
jgi:hypothetical protein